MAADASVSVWTVLTVVLMPLLGGAFMLLWHSLNNHTKQDADHHDQMWSAINRQRDDLAAHKVDSATNFSRKQEVRAEIAALEERIVVRLDRMEQKLDRAQAINRIKTMERT